jgi:uncharacterized protein YbjT (DUF2867 family)
MKIIVTGATGTTGSEVIRQAILDKEISSIVALARKPLDLKHEKLSVIPHQDFLDYSSLNGLFSGSDAIIWCLGVSQFQVKKEQYSVITHDYTIAAAKAALQANPSIGFVFVSGDGADPTETSRALFARIKGKTENSLTQLPFKKLYIARPGGIKPVHKNKNMAFVNKLALPLFPLLELIAPGAIISSVQLAKSLLKIAKTGNDKFILDNKALKELAG